MKTIRAIKKMSIKQILGYTILMICYTAFFMGMVVACATVK